MKNKGKSKRIFSESFKQEVMQSVLDGRYTKEGARRHYGIQGKSTILKWLRKYGYAEAAPGRGVSVRLNASLSALELSVQELETKRKELEKENRSLSSRLSRSETEALAWRKMVEVAEIELGIEIRKKSVTKRSKK